MTILPTKTRLVSLPNELIAEVLGRVAASSVADMFNAKLSCKTLNNISEDSHVYQSATLDKFPVAAWKPLAQEKEAFINKCKECGNPELMYRQAVVDYFTKSNVASSIENLDKALKLGYPEALYVACIILLLSGDDKEKSHGIKLMGEIKSSKSLRGNLRWCRNKLISTLNQVWVKNPVLLQRPVCCSTRDQHPYQKKNQWLEDIDDDREDEMCAACTADAELGLICCRYSFR